ncbi:MAG: DNA alkylation repair protein [Anaerolinea sp.]|nr:DNA alkylation repair protein [Anaerolinea sp.]
MALSGHERERDDWRLRLTARPRTAGRHTHPGRSRLNKAEPGGKQPFAEFVPRLRERYEANRDAATAAPMAAYMRGKFEFLGIKGPLAHRLLREALAGLTRPTQAELQEAAEALWALPEREYKYAGAAILRRYVAACDASFLPVAQELILTKPWWDTVDALAANVVGPLVARHPELGAVMDEWILSEDIWLARTALLHQLKYRARTDAAKLTRYCLLRGGDKEFFIRKAIGWALREYSKTDADAVRAFVARHDGELSGLSKREALLWLNGRKPKARTAD